MKLKKKKSPKLKAKCGHCQRRAQAKHECITCEKLIKAGKVEAIFAVHACGHHQGEALAIMKKHVLTAHPVNILRGVVAQLKGEDVF